MCGRYTVIATPELLRALFGYPERPNFPARYNIAPTQPIAVVRMMNGARQFALVRWGLLPPWVKDPKTFALLFNARGDTVNDKPAYKAAMKRRRCLIPADGFYEWESLGAYRQPYYVKAKSGDPLAFAGLWESWMGPNGEELETATIITTEANDTLRPIHHRMPVIVPPAQFDLWLGGADEDTAEATALIKPAPGDRLEAFPVSAEVNRVANDSPRLIERTAELTLPPPKIKRAAKAKEPDGQGVLF